MEGNGKLEIETLSYKSGLSVEHGKSTPDDMYEDEIQEKDRSNRTPRSTVKELLDPI
ncbi:MAG: hypothetical protein ACLFQ8_02490 [Candidatus Aenigmatarchaeota archaeon]